MKFTVIGVKNPDNRIGALNALMNQGGLDFGKADNIFDRVLAGMHTELELPEKILNTDIVHIRKHFDMNYHKGSGKSAQAPTGRKTLQLKLWEVSYSSYRGSVGTDYIAMVLAETKEDAILSVAGDTPRLKPRAKKIEGPFKNRHVLMTRQR